MTLVENLLKLSGLPSVTSQNLISLLTLILEQNFFMFNGKFFKQISGLAMGSCLSPFLSEVFMHSLEVKIMESPFAKFLTFSGRYVDDF